jgi:hypothetical protein
LHDTQVSVHALSQHTPSTQKPEAQATALEQAVPFFALQLPLPSQACPAGQLAEASGPAAAQVPSCPATPHDWQVPAQDATLQHTPSTQKPEAQVDAAAALHPSPLPRFVTLYSQVSSMAKVGSAVKLPPKSTTAPRWLSKATASPVRATGPEEATRS